MLTQAQGEKAVTISEPMGRRPWSSKIVTTSKIQVQLWQLKLERQVRALSVCAQIGIFRLVFNGLRNQVAGKRKPSRTIRKYLQNRAFVLLRDARFGPSFVTIMPTGVWVCSF
jgi:hypothetical protein